MQHHFHKVVGLQHPGDYRLRLSFDDGQEREVDLAEVGHGELFSPLRDPEFFAQVQLDETWGTITWPNGADLDPDLLYRWDEFGSQFLQQIKHHPAAIAPTSVSE